MESRFLKGCLAALLALPVMLCAAQPKTKPTNKMLCSDLNVKLNQFRHNNSTKNHPINAMALYVSQDKGNKPLCYVFSGTVRKGIPQALSKSNLWKIASVSKGYFAAMLLQVELASQRKTIPIDFNIDQPLKKWLPEYPDWANVTVRQLLNMTSGIVDDANSGQFLKMMRKHPEKVWTAEQVIQMAYQQSPNTYFKPGQGYHYSNTAYVVAGLLLQQLNHLVYKKREGLSSLFQQHMVEPYHLKDTYYFDGNIAQTVLVRMAHGYNYDTDIDTTNFNMSLAQASGGIIATPKAVSQWLLDLFNGKVLPTKQLQKMQSLVSMSTGQPMTLQQAMQSGSPAYGLGLMMQPSRQYGPIWMYQGISYGYTTVYMYVPKFKTIIVYTAGLGSLRQNPVKFTVLGRQLMKQLLL